MDIKILDSWLREHIDTKATPQEIKRFLSLCGPSVEKIEKVNFEGKSDYIYFIEVTTNRVDMMSVRGIAREAAVILSQFGFEAKLKKLELDEGNYKGKSEMDIEFKPDPKLVYRIMAVVMEINSLGKTPASIKDKLEASEIRSLNTTVDITNYVMTEIGHPTHVFDFDQVKPLIKVRESKKGEEIESFDGIKHSLPGGDIVFENNKREIIDLPGIIGTKNSVVKENTKRILFFIDNNDPTRIRKTSMKLGIRTVAATLNEKGVDPSLAETALKRGIYLYKKLLNAKQLSKIYDIYPSKTVSKKVSLNHSIIESKLGISIEPKKVVDILNKLEIKTSYNKKSKTYDCIPPSYRTKDIEIKEDIIEEIARIYGYHNIPSKLMTGEIPDFPKTDSFDFESKVKMTLKGLGGIEVYTLSLVSESQIKGPALKIKNPLGKDGEYLRNNMTESILSAYKANAGQKEPYHLFEIANIYLPQKNNLPKEELRLAGIFFGYSYRKAKGVVESILKVLNIIPQVEIVDSKGFNPMQRIVFNLNGELGEFGVLENGAIYYDFNMQKLNENYKEYAPFKELTKFPAQIEDITLQFASKTKISDVINYIKSANNLISSAELKDIYNDSFTFRINYQSFDKTLTDSEVKKIRDEILKKLETNFGATTK